jgi:hypothetical protein
VIVEKIGNQQFADLTARVDPVVPEPEKVLITLDRVGKIGQGQVSEKTERPILGCDLRLMSSVKDVNGIPTAGKNLIIVAAVDNVLHFRIFDLDGKVVLDTDEKHLAEQARQIEDLRKQLESLWPPHELTRPTFRS